MAQPLFAWFETVLNDEADKRFAGCLQISSRLLNLISESIRGTVKALETNLRAVETALQQVHSLRADQSEAVLENVATLLAGVRSSFEQLQAAVPVAQFYRFCSQWKNSIQQAVSLAALLVYLQHGKLLDGAQFEQLTSVPLADEARFHVELDDFLVGLCNLFPELSRLATNSVTLGDFARVPRISAFLNDVYNGFRLLNLKNDMLRKRYDGTKYDLKKIESIVYDLSIRGLLPREG